MRVKRIFCSKKCHDEAQKITIVKVCIICKKEFCVRPSEYKKFVTCSRECFLKAKCSKRNPNWRGGTTKNRRPEMSTIKYKNWKNAVFKKDNYTCQHCGTRGGTLNADHIKPWAYFPNLRYVIENGRTLCLKCHRKTFKSVFLWRKNKMGYIAVDLDRTLAFYEKYEGAGHIGKPIPKMVERVKKWIAEGKEIKIMTARVSNANHNEDEIKKARTAIQKWCLQHIGKALDVTCEKDYEMMELWDDRAIGVIPNTGERADGKED